MRGYTNNVRPALTKPVYTRFLAVWPHFGSGLDSVQHWAWAEKSNPPCGTNWPSVFLRIREQALDMYVAIDGQVCPYLCRVSYQRPMLTRPTPKQFLLHPCPSCGVAAGMLCERHSGRPRKEPHVDRKVAAFEAVVEGEFRSPSPKSKRIFLN